jgi:hypothetical protein
MPENFKAVIPGKLYRSGQIAPSELKSLTITPFYIRKIVCLDQNTGIMIKPYIPQGVQQIMFPLLEGNGSVEARKLADSIRSGLLDENSGATLVCCRRGIDRTGLAIALFRVIKQGQACTTAIEEAKSQGYGSGLDPNILAQYNTEICRNCTVSHTHYVQIVSSKPTDISQVDDIVDEVRNDLSHQDGWNSVGAIPNGTSTEYSFAPFSDSTVEGPFGAKSASKSASRKARKSLLKKIIKLIDKKEEDNNDIDLPDSGLIDNYKGEAADQFGAPSASPGAPNAGGFVDPGGLVQL